MACRFLTMVGEVGVYLTSACGGSMNDTYVELHINQLEVFDYVKWSPSFSRISLACRQLL
jgi:hypothetical protein